MFKIIDAPTSEPNRLVQQFIERLKPLIPFDSAGVYRYDPAAETLVPLAMAGDAAIPAISALPVIARSEGVIGQAAARLQPVRADDVGAESRQGWIDPQALSGLAAPVQDGDTLLGVLLVTHRQPNAYTPEHEQTAQALADHLAVLLKTIRQNRALLGAHNQLVEQMEGHRRELAALQRLATITSATADLDDMLANALRETAEILNCDGAQILLPDHVHYELALHDYSLYGIVQAWPRRTWALDGPGTVVDVYHTGIAKYENDPPPVDGVTCRNALYCPLNTRQRTLGVLNLVNRRAGDFNDAHLELAEAIARQVAVSISSAQQFAAERSRAEMLNLINHISQELYAILNQQALLRRTADLIRETLPPDVVYIVLLDEDGDLMHLEAQAVSDPLFAIEPDYALHKSQGVVGRAVRTGEVQIVPDLRIDPDYVALDAGHRLQSCLMVPLRRSDEGTGEMVIGAIMALSTQINAFSEIDRDGLETLATQVSIALENARLYQEMQRRLLERNVVYQIGQDLTVILNLSELCNAVVQHMNRALNTSACRVELFEEKHRTVRVEADFRADHHRQPEGAGLTGAYLALDEHYAIAEAIQTRQPVTFYTDDPAIPDDARELLNELGDHSQLVVPMVAGERVIGAVEWIDQQEGRRFSHDDIRLARTLVAQATIAIQNAQLFTELEERARQLAEADQLRSQFLAMISHELRTPMNSIIGFSETIMEGLYGELNERQLSRLDRIRENGYTLLALIDDLLDLSKIDAGRLTLNVERIALPGIIRATAQTLETQMEAKGLMMVFDTPADLPRVQADPQRLAQVITNLLGNAIKFTHDGSIAVECSVVERQGRAFVQTSVIDTGIGISKADQDIIFDEFRQVDSGSTRQYGGTGMGLAITRRLVEMMDGTIWVASDLGVGSTFTFTLPVAE